MKIMTKLLDLTETTRYRNTVVPFFINFTVYFPHFGILILIFIKFHRLV
jgi:hypothetical protein